jgi:serine protease
MTRVTIAALTALAAAGAMAATAGAASASISGGAAAAPQPAAVSNPYSPAYNHSYRHGATPTRATEVKMRQWAQSHPHAAPAAGTAANDLNYGGGIDGIGVTTGAEKVYLVFYGSQWGSQSTNANGDVTLSNDPSGLAPYVQEFMKGLGTNNELWSGVMTQYCQGVAAGTQICPAGNTQHVGYPTGGALAGVWVDESTASPSAASGHQLGVEAVNAASHFGNTSAALNRNAQYVIISPTGANPDNYQTQGFCAWHDYNGDTTLSGGAVSSSVGDVSFTNLPYIPDAGASCGQNFVNSNGPLDGVSIVEGHEYAETVTDQNPAGGYTDSSGAENGDKCAWITPGTSGGSFDLTDGHGTFAVQTTWGNDGNNNNGTCQASHAIVSNGGGTNTVTVTSPGNQSGTVGSAVSLQISASDSASGQTLTFSASGLPAGLSISSSGLITGTPTTAATSSVTVTATDTTGAHGSASFTWTISNPTGNTVTVTSPGNQSGTVGTAVSLQIHATDSASGQTLTYTAHHPHRHPVPDGDHPGRLHRHDVQLLAAHRHRRGHHHDPVRQADHHRRRHHDRHLLQPQPRQWLHPAHLHAARQLRRHQRHGEVLRHRGLLAGDVLRG